jgi:hypothetical protein
MRPALGLEETLELLVKQGLLDEPQAREVESRVTTLRSSVLKERVGSVRSQAAARYDVSPAETVAAAHFPHPNTPCRQSGSQFHNVSSFPSFHLLSMVQASAECDLGFPLYLCHEI